MKKAKAFSDEYLHLQQSFIDKQIEWNQKLQIEINLADNISANQPLIHEMSWKADADQLLQCFHETLALFDSVSGVKDDVDRLGKAATTGNVVKWVQTGIMQDSGALSELAKEIGVEKWLFNFAIENVARSVLQVIARSEQEALSKIELFGACPCCSEPPRLAEINDAGKKALVCPRCHHQWVVKKTACAYCGSEDHTKMTFIQNTEGSHEQVQVCENCYNYTKIIDTKRNLAQVSPTLLDLQSIHLDYIAADFLEEQQSKIH